MFCYKNGPYLTYLTSQIRWNEALIGWTATLPVPSRWCRSPSCPRALSSRGCAGCSPSRTFCRRRDSCARAPSRGPRARAAPGLAPGRRVGKNQVFFFFKHSPVVFWLFFGFLVFFGFLGFFHFQEYFRCIQTLNYNQSY
jgi:hypothetical protein